MKRGLIGLAALMIQAAWLSVAPAHYLWVAVDEKDGEKGTAHLYFEEGPAPGDGHYLDPFTERGKMWVRTIGAEKPEQLKMTVTTKPGKKWLSAPLTKAAPRSVESYGKFGVYPYGKTDVLLHYFARYMDVSDHDDLHELGKSDQMDLQIVPHDAADAMELTVYWHGKPAANRPIYLRGPKNLRKNLKTDEAGKVRFTAAEKGRYICRTYVEEAKPGKEGEKEYQLIRYHSSLTMDLPLGGP